MSGYYTDYCKCLDSIYGGIAPIMEVMGGVIFVMLFIYILNLMYLRFFDLH